MAGLTGFELPEDDSSNSRSTAGERTGDVRYLQANSSEISVRWPNAIWRFESSLTPATQNITNPMAGGAWGWHIETPVHMLRVKCGGVFDRFPKLQFVIGHMGEGLPFFFQRLDIIPVATTKLKRPISAYLKENVHYTFSGMNYPELFLNLLLQLGSVDRIMFSADYPYQSMQQARTF